MGVWQPDFQIFSNCLILEHGFCLFSLIKLAKSRFTKDFESPYTNRNPQGRFGIQFLKFYKFGQKEKRQSSKSNLTVLHALTLFQFFA